MPFLRNGSETPSDTGTFENLVHDLSVALGPSSGLDSDDVDPMNIQRLMEKYVSNSVEWGPYALGDSSRAYTRNLIDEGNGKSNLVSQLFDQCFSTVYCILTPMLVDPRVEPWEKKCDSRSCQCTLRDEGKLQKPWP